MAASVEGLRCCYGLTSRYFASSLKFGDCIQIRNYAARKGTREKARKKKVKVEQKKVEWVPPKLRAKSLQVPATSKRIKESYKGISPDNVWINRYYRWKVYSFAEAVQCHRETHHPTIYNVPDAPLSAFIELDMSTDKKTKFVDNFTRVVSVPHQFDIGEERRVLVFAKTEEEQNAALEAGATVAGGSNIIKDIQSGDLLIHEFNYVIAHPNIFPELVPIRGLFKRRFPNARAGTLGPDVVEIVKRFAHGVLYTARKDEHEQDYGVIEACIGNLTMETTHLEENFAALLQDVHAARVRRKANFITRTLLVCPPSNERFKIDHGCYVEVFKDETETVKEADDTEEEEEEVKVAQAST